MTQRNSNIIQSQSSDCDNSMILTVDFFHNMYQLQKEYEENGQQTELIKLMSVYTDCVTYYQMKEEQVAQYFKNKIKDTVLNLRLFSKKGQSRAVSFNTQVIKLIEKKNINQIIDKQNEKVAYINKNIAQILKTQQENIQKRRKDIVKKRSMTHKHSMVGSLQSLQSQPGQQSKISKKEYFFGKQMKFEDYEQLADEFKL